MRAKELKRLCKNDPPSGIVERFRVAVQPDAMLSNESADPAHRHGCVLEPGDCWFPKV